MTMATTPGIRIDPLINAASTLIRRLERGLDMTPAGFPLSITRAEADEAANVLNDLLQVAVLRHIDTQADTPPKRNTKDDLVRRLAARREECVTLRAKLEARDRQIDDLQALLADATINYDELREYVQLRWGVDVT